MTVIVTDPVQLLYTMQTLMDEVLKFYQDKLMSITKDTYTFYNGSRIQVLVDPDVDKPNIKLYQDYLLLPTLYPIDKGEILRSQTRKATYEFSGM